MLDDLLQGADAGTAEVLEKTPRAATQFLDPTGETIGDTLHHEEGLAYATFDLNECVEPKQFHDIVGYYNRFDIFDLRVDRRRLAPARFVDDAEAEVAANHGAHVEPRADEAGAR
jgi:aliphatic nitrilase